MGYYFSIISLILGLICWRKSQRFLNPGTVFCFLWTMILFLSSLSLYELNSCSDITYVRIMYGVVSFTIGFLLDYTFLKTKTIKVVSRKTNNLASNYEYEPRYKFLYIILVYMIIEGILRAGNSFTSLINGGDLQSLRMMAGEINQERRGTWGNVIDNLITAPIEIVIYPICAYNLLNGKQSCFSFMTLIVLILGIIRSGGRANLIYFIICICVVYFFSKKKNKMDPKAIKNKVRQSRKFRIVVFILLFAFIIISMSRSGQKLIKDMYLYFAMEPTMFEQWNERIDLKGLYGYGEASLNGFTFHILYIIKNFLGIDYPSHWYDIYNIILKIDSDWVSITNNGLPANAYVSIFWYFYLDAREIGIILFSMIYGIFCSKYFRKVQHDFSMKNICIYSLVMFGVFDSYVRMRFAIANYAAGFIILNYFIFKKRERIS